MSRVVKLAVIPGDGIGPEVVAEAEKVLDAVAEGSGIRFDKTRFSLGAERYLLYATVSRPEERLYLSWHAADDEGEPEVRSAFVDDVARLFDDAPLARGGAFVRSGATKTDGSASCLCSASSTAKPSLVSIFDRFSCITPANSRTSRASARLSVACAVSRASCASRTKVTCRAAGWFGGSTCV